jgi:outer membrane receptor protein involved in Fe transport
LNLGAELQVRSGYPFSPIRSGWTVDESKLYRWEYYRATLEDENSLRFQTNAYLNLSGRYQMGRVELLLSVANVTNRANPVVYSATGPIYDAGILPMLGVRIKL